MVYNFFSVFCRTKINFETEKSQSEVCVSPGKLSTGSNHDASIHQPHMGKIGSKVIPVAPTLDSVEHDCAEQISHNSNNSDSNSCNNNNVAYDKSDVDA